MSDNNSKNKKCSLSPVTGRKMISRQAILSSAMDIQVPALPRTLRMVHALMAERTVDARSIADAIMTDCGLTLKFFRIMNSAFFSPYRQDILSIRFMIVLLGFDNAAKVTASVPLMNISDCRLSAKVMAMSLLASEFVSELCEITDMERESAVPCAMFASLGHLVLATVVPDAYGNLWEQEKFPWNRGAFKRTTGWLPKELAFRVARAWNLPVLIRECIKPPDDISRMKDDRQALIITVSSLEQIIFCAALMRRSDEIQSRLRGKIKKVLKLSNKKLSAAVNAGILGFEKNNPVFYELLRQAGILQRIIV